MKHGSILQALIGLVVVAEIVGCAATDSVSHSKSNVVLTGSTSVMTIAKLQLVYELDGQFEVGATTPTPAGRLFFNAESMGFMAPIKALQEVKNTSAERGKSMTLEEEGDAIYKLIPKYESRPILIVGHTDDTGNSLQNQRLSEERALAVAKIFADRISKNRLFYRGAGDSTPIADNRTAEGRKRNRRVEIIELDSYVQLEDAFSIRREKPEFLRPKKNIRVNVEKSSPEIVEKDRVGISLLDFGGKPVSEKSNHDLVASMGKAIQPEKSLIFGALAVVVGDARASDEKVYELPCTADAPRYGGSYKSLETGKTVGADVKTSDYLPGLYQTSWVTAVSGNYVGITPVGVLRKNFQPASQPNMLVYKDTVAPGKSAKASHRIPMQVSVYPGEKGILYRMYSTGKTNVVCADVIMPRQAPFEAASGMVYYNKSGKIYQESYTPHMLGSGR